MIRMFSLISVCCFLILVAITPSRVLAHNGLDVFVTPIPNAPFSGTILVERTMFVSEGSVATFRTIRDIGRDRKGRVYNEFRSLLPSASKETPRIITVHLYDPMAHTFTLINHLKRTYRISTLDRSQEAVPNTALLCDGSSGNAMPRSQYIKEEDLGKRVVDGVPEHGLRVSHTFPATSDGSLKEAVVTDECWYSKDLHINMVIKHDDPRTGGVTMTVTQVKRTEPDSARFKIPEGFTQDDVRQEVKP